MKAVRIIVLALILVFIAIQFISSGIPANKPEDEKSIVHSGLANDDVINQLRKSCFDCHSNQTKFPWYSKIAPTSWLLAGHIKEGKDKLNFSEWDNYSQRKKAGLLDKIKDEVESGDMPLKSYVLIHRNARMSPDEVSALSKWADETVDRLLK